MPHPREKRAGQATRTIRAARRPDDGHFVERWASHSEQGASRATYREVGRAASPAVERGGSADSEAPRAAGGTSTVEAIASLLAAACGAETAALEQATLGGVLVVSSA